MCFLPQYVHIWLTTYNTQRVQPLLYVSVKNHFTPLAYFVCWKVKYSPIGAGVWTLGPELVAVLESWRIFRKWIMTGINGLLGASLSFLTCPQVLSVLSFLTGDARPAPLKPSNWTKLNSPSGSAFHQEFHQQWEKLTNTGGYLEMICHIWSP